MSALDKARAERKAAAGDPLPDRDAPVTTGGAKGSVRGKRAADDGAGRHRGVIALPASALPAAPPPLEWPSPPAPEAFYGLMGDIVRTIEPHTEADPVALLVQALVMFGSVCGRTAYLMADGTVHHTNEFAVLAGSTSSGRKGTSHNRLKPLFDVPTDDWLPLRNAGGLSSAEGLLWSIRDGSGEDDDGVSDKRLSVTETEFANVLKQTERQGNTLSVYLRQFWDGQETIRTLTKNSPAKVTNGHVSVVGHITPEELHRYLTATETANGLANRFLFACVRRSKFLPDGGSLDPAALAPLRDRLWAAVRFARTAGEVRRHPSAKPLWHAVYPILTGDSPGLHGAMTARAAPHVLRLAMLYALLDHSAVILTPHLMAGIALWDYCDRSVRHLFGERIGNPQADELRELLRNAPGGLTRTELGNALGRHQYGDRLTASLTVLHSAGLARQEKEATGGRPGERWYATRQLTEESPLLATARKTLIECVESVRSPSDDAADAPFTRLPRFARTIAVPTDADPADFPFGLHAPAGHLIDPGGGLPD